MHGVPIFGQRIPSEPPIRDILLTPPLLLLHWEVVREN